MKEAYIFSDRANKFAAPLGTNQCSLNKVIGTFLSAPTCPILEVSISMYGKWYWDLPLAEVMAHNESEHCDEWWQYNVFLLYPKMVQNSKEEGRQFNWAISLANFLYERIQWHLRGYVLYQYSIAFWSHHKDCWMSTLRKWSAWFQKTLFQTKDVAVIWAITFHNGTGNEGGSSFVVWLLVAPSCES